MALLIRWFYTFRIAYLKSVIGFQSVFLSSVFPPVSPTTAAPTLHSRIVCVTHMVNLNLPQNTFRAIFSKGYINRLVLVWDLIF